MASSDAKPSPTATSGTSGGAPGDPTTVKSHLLDMGAQMLQTLKPINHMQQHICTFALYAHDPSRQIETHHFASRLNQDVLQCAVYDSDNPYAHLIGVEYIISDRLFESLPEEEQRLWHSHAHEIKSGLWMNPHVPEMISRPELRNLARSYGKFWCTWQSDRGDQLPLGAPALMVSPQETGLGRVRPDIVKSRDDRYGVSTDQFREARDDIEELKVVVVNVNADYWKNKGKGFVIDVVEADLKR